MVIIGKIPPPKCTMTTRIFFTFTSLRTSAITCGRSESLSGQFRVFLGIGLFVSLVLDSYYLILSPAAGSIGILFDFWVDARTDIIRLRLMYKY